MSINLAHYFPLPVEFVPMAFKLGSLSHAKGFVVNKLFEQGRFGGKHLPVFLLSQGYPPQLRHLITKAVDELKREGIIRIIKKRTGRDYADHATLVEARLSQARPLLTGFRSASKLPRLGSDLKTFLPK